VKDKMRRLKVTCLLHTHWDSYYYKKKISVGEGTEKLEPLCIALLYTCNAVLFSLKKKWSSDTYCTMDEL
jgi:hypothetical protein